MLVTTREFLDASDEVLDTPVSGDTGEDYALVIGVNDYPKLRSLHGAIADAHAFKDWLISFEGGRVPASNVHTIVSKQDPLAPIGHEINDTLENILERANETGGRRFYFYFSGHGCVGDRASDISLCLANWSELRRRAALSSDAWLDVVVRSGAFAEVAFFLDCCRVWAARAVGLPPHIDFARPVEREEPTRVFVAYATEFQRVAVESSAHESDGVRGIFTGTLLRGLSGYAAKDDNGVTADSLKHYLEAAIRGRRQRAEVQNGFRRDAQIGFAVRRQEATPPGAPGVVSQRLLSFSLPKMSADLTSVVTIWLQSLAIVAIGLNPFPEVTWNHTEWKHEPCRVVVVSFDDGLPAIGWSIHGAGVDIALNGANTWVDVASNLSVFSARLAPGEYVLRRSGTRDYALRLHAGFDSQVIISPTLGHPRIRWIPWINATPQLPLVNEVEVFGLILAPEPEGAAMEGRLSRIEKIIAGEPFDDPVLGLLAGYRLCQTDARNPARIDAIADRVEALLGPAPDIHALRLRAALLRGSNLPVVACYDPPVFREGLLAFIDASHILPDIVASGSLLEHACVHRFVDTTLSSWPYRDDSRPTNGDWLATAVAELALEDLVRGKTVDARTMAKELRVPTLAVQARMCETSDGYARILQRSDESNRCNVVNESTAIAESANKKAEMMACIRQRDYRGALAVAEELLATEPNNDRLRSIYRTCLYRTVPTSNLVLRVIARVDEGTSLGFNNETQQFLGKIGNELPVCDIVINARLERPNTIREVHRLIQRRIIEIVRVPAQPI